PLGKSLWIVGTDVKKCDLDLNLQFKVKLPLSTFTAAAFSVDVNPDGSAWVAGRNAYELKDGGNQLLKISPEGLILRVIALDFCPQCVRIDRSDGSVWTTGRIRRKDYSRIADRWPETVTESNKLVDAGVQTCTRKYDPEGRLLLASTQGGMSIEVDPSDGSVWLAGDKNIWYYSSRGTNLATYTGVSADRKWLAVIPSEAGRQSQPGRIDRGTTAPSSGEPPASESNPTFPKTTGILQKQPADR
ncbi:MAG: NHL repeat-containing protein, partial [Planctomycetota bacterium]